MLVHIGMFVYMLVKSCSYDHLGLTAYPVDDNLGERRIIVCADFGANQTQQIFVHELVHACLHDHEHHFKTKEELQYHVDTVKEQKEETLAIDLAYCMVPVLENNDVKKFLGEESQ